MSRASTEGASARAATSREACSLDRFTTREPSRSCRGEGHVCGASVRRNTRPRSRRGMGRSTRARRGTEHERPVCAARVGAAWPYKPMAKSIVAQRASEGTVVATSLATNNAGGAKGPCGGHVGGRKDARGHGRQVRSQSPASASADGQSAPIATPTVGRGQAIPGATLSCADGSDLEE